ncbi:MAG: hypothetical protein N2510_01775 [Ignavibacteria bacterium]|nr:hypothetical protein [Ignavibacteria bacterium]
MIAFTSDIDWAPEAVIADTIEIFEKYGVKCTFFSTHYSPVLNSCNRKLFEIGIHPNFNPLLSGKEGRAEDILFEIMELHPDAEGVRCHSMLQSSLLLHMFAERKLLYESNHFLPYHHGLKPFKLWNGLVRIPYNWEDDVHWSYGYDFSDSKMNLEDEGLVIFDFHPIHIFLNTENKYRYQEAKKFYNDPDKLLELRNKEVPGARDLLLSLLDYCKSSKKETFKQIEIARSFLYGGGI